MKRSSKLLVMSIASCAVLIAAAILVNSSSLKLVTQSQDTHSVDQGDDASPEAIEPTVPKDCFATILVYHHIQEHFTGENQFTRGLTVSPSKLAKQFEYLEKNHYSVISYGQLIDCVTEGTLLPEKSVVLTFDGRWKSQKTHALPLLNQHKMTATFFVPIDARESLPLMSWDDLKELSNAGMTIGSHVRVHPLLTQQDQDKWFVKELNESRQTLKQHLGFAPRLLAYPYDGHERLHTMTEQAGFVAARSLDAGSVHNRETLLAMKAYNAPEYLQAFATLLQK